MHNSNRFDCTAFGLAVKEARNKTGLTREQLGERLDRAPRYLLSIENKGQHRSLQVFYDLATMFQISIDQFFFPDNSDGRTSRRRYLETVLDELDDDQLAALHAELCAWNSCHNSDAAPVNWRFTSPDARIRLRSLYPVVL